MKRCALAFVSILSVGCAAGELGCPKAIPPVTTTIKLAHALCERGEAWEPCLKRAYAHSSAEGDSTVIMLEPPPK